MSLKASLSLSFVPAIHYPPPVGNGGEPRLAQGHRVASGKKKKKTEEQRWQRGARLQLRVSKPPTPAPSRPQALLGWRASSPPRGLARPKEVHSRCSVSKIDGTHLFPFVPGDSPTQLVMTGSEGGTPPQALRKIVATKATSRLTC